MSGKNLLITAAIIIITANIFKTLAQVRIMQPARDSIVPVTEIFYPINDDYMTGTTDGISLTDTSEIRGEDTEDGWFSFNVSSLSFWSVIDSIRFYGYVNSTDSANWSLTPLSLIPGYNSPSEIKEYIEEHSDSSIAYTYMTWDSTFTTGWHNWLLGNGAAVNLRLSAGYIFRVGMDSRDNSTGHYIKWDGWAQANIPYIKVTYHSYWIWDYFENFDNDMFAWLQVACQDPVHWTTWNLTPCSPWEDPYVTDDISYSGPNSVRIVGDNDLIQKLGITSGPWLIEFWFYIPSGRNGYFAVMAEFFGEPKIFGMQCYFHEGGYGSLVIGETINFNWLEDTWQKVQVFVDLDQGSASFRIGNSEIASWDWTRNGTIPFKLDAVDFYGDGYNNEMYFDNYRIYCTYVPVELTSFIADVKSGNVILRWETATERNNYGFEVQRSEVRDQRSEVRDQWERIGFVNGNGTVTEPRSYSFTDNNISPGKYSYRLKQIDYDGTFKNSNVIEVNVENTPMEYSLSQNYPNPFNPATKIKYSIPSDGFVTLTVYNVIGQKIAELVKEVVKAGTYEVNFDASKLSSGVYYYNLETNGFVSAKKMILIR